MMGDYGEKDAGRLETSRSGEELIDDAGFMVNVFSVERREVDAGDFFAGMPHACTDNGNGDFELISSGCPTVAGAIGCERRGRVAEACEAVQMTVVSV